MTTPEDSYQRYFVGHRLEFAPTTNVRVGLSETALIATSGAMPFWALNPLLPWVMAEQEKRGTQEKTNIVWAVDTVWNIGNWVAYGQFLLDDYMIDSEDRNTYPDQLGCMVGMAHERLSPGKESTQRLGLEYTRLWSWTYIHRDPELIYQAWQQGIGHPAGSDSESVTAFWSLAGKNPWQSLIIWGRYHRQGQAWLGTALDPVGSPGLSYPIPPVSNWWQTGLDIEVRPHQAVTTRLRLGWTDTQILPDEDSLSPVPDQLTAVSQWHGSLTVSIDLGSFTIHP